MGIALWIVPDEHDTARLKTIMHGTRQASRPDFPSSYPDFQPHVTLASMSTIPQVSDIQAAIAPIFQRNADGLPVNFESVDIGSHFYRSVYIAITPSTDLHELHANVHAKLGLEPRTPAYPHVSLCYISDEDKEERERFFEELKIRSNEDIGVSLGCGPDGDDWIRDFRAREVWIAQCDGPVEGWTVLHKIRG